MKYPQEGIVEKQTKFNQRERGDYGMFIKLVPKVL